MYESIAVFSAICASNVLFLACFALLNNPFSLVIEAIAIPANVHRQDSATYGGRNRSQTGPDSENLRAAIDKDFDQIKPVLMRDYGATEEALEAARKEMHRINTELGLYK